jgi:hypothetical protein
MVYQLKNAMWQYRCVINFKLLSSGKELVHVLGVSRWSSSGFLSSGI